MPLAVNTAVCATAISVLWGVGCALSIALRPQEHIPILHDEFLMECMTHPQMICLHQVQTAQRLPHRGFLARASNLVAPLTRRPRRSCSGRRFGSITTRCSRGDPSSGSTGTHTTVSTGTHTTVRHWL